MTEALQLIYEEYVGHNMEDFKDILDMATVDGGYMLIDNMTDSADICDIVYRYSPCDRIYEEKVLLR
jgi:hypothetical protein